MGKHRIIKALVGCDHVEFLNNSKGKAKRISEPAGTEFIVTNNNAQPLDIVDTPEEEKHKAQAYTYVTYKKKGSDKEFFWVESSAAEFKEVFGTDFKDALTEQGLVGEKEGWKPCEKYGSFYKLHDGVLFVAPMNKDSSIVEHEGEVDATPVLHAAFNDEELGEFAAHMEKLFGEKVLSASPFNESSGKIKNEYIGKTAKEIWKSWSGEQRHHFCIDHNIYDKENNIVAGSLETDDFDKLPAIAKSRLAEHIAMGQYGSGGELSGSSCISDYFLLL